MKLNYKMVTQFTLLPTLFLALSNFVVDVSNFFSECSVVIAGRNDEQNYKNRTRVAIKLNKF